MSDRADLLQNLAEHIASIPCNHVLRVAVDGVDGAGKTTFAEALANVLQHKGKMIIRASVDDFHHARAVRYWRGPDSSDGFYLDSYNYGLLKKVLLDPLGPGGSGCYRTKAFDHITDLPVALSTTDAERGAILVFDGIFLHRPELRNYWDFSVFLDVPFEISIPRGAARGAGFGSPDPGAPSNKRYIDGQKRYLSECDPKARATVVVNNSELAMPVVATVCREGDGGGLT